MLEIRRLDKQFADKIVADGIDLRVDAGCLTAVLGASGSGKSTLLNMVAGLLSPDGGEIVLGGTLLNPLPPQKREVAMMFQDFALLPWRTVADNIALVLEHHPLSAAERRSGPRCSVRRCWSGTAGRWPR